MGQSISKSPGRCGSAPFEKINDIRSVDKNKLFFTVLQRFLPLITDPLSKKYGVLILFDWRVGTQGGSALSSKTR